MNVLGRWPLVLVGLVLVGPRLARAQDAGACTPACLAGEVCVAGTCMTPACRPPCGAGESCVGGTCMVPARRPAPEPAPVEPRPRIVPDAPVAWSPPATAVVEEVARPPVVRKGSFVIPQVGVNTFQEETAQSLSPGLRLAGLVGGHVSNAVSLGGTLTFDWMNWDLPSGYDASSFIFEAAFTPLFHAGDSRAEFVVGPALGVWMRSFDAHSAATGNMASSTARGLSLGGNFGLFVPVSTVRVGGMFSFMFRDPTSACETVNGRETCAGDQPAHQVMGFALAVML